MKPSLLRTNEELEQIYQRHVNTVYRVCFMLTKSKSEAEDMVQNTFLRLMGDGTSFESHEHEKAWLIRTATNLCKDFFRRWRNRMVSMEDMDIPVEPSFEVDETLKKVMALPPKYKTALYMYYYEGYSTVEMARILNKKESTIRGHLFTGRKLLKMELEGDFNEGT